MKILKNKFDKTAINELPIVSFEGKVYTIISQLEAEHAVRYLMTKSILGIRRSTFMGAVMVWV